MATVPQVERLSIVTMPFPTLRQRAEEITEFDSERLRAIADQMFALIAEDNKGIGLAANQVGLLIRLIVVAVPGYPPIVMCNPVIGQRWGWAVAEEGCLSLPGIRRRVGRARKIHVTYRTVDGKEQSFVARDLLARCILHESDHLSGRLIIDVATHSRSVISPPWTR